MKLDIDPDTFDDPGKQKRLVKEANALWEELQSLPSHVDWVTLGMFNRMIINLIKTEIHIDHLDQLIMNDPPKYSFMNALRTSSTTRAKGLRGQLGIDAVKMGRTLKPAAKQKRSMMASLEHEDYKA